MRFSFLILSLLWASSCYARVFDMKDLSLAPYLRGTFGDAWTHQEAFIQGLGSTSVDQTITYSFSGELGVMFRVAPMLNLRVGAEILSPTPITGAEGKDANGNLLLTMNSNIFVFNPQVAMEFEAHRFKSGGRILWTGGVGYASVSLKNQYTVTTAGQTALGLPSYDESASATVINAFTSVAWEFYMIDRILGMLEMGYRYFPVSGLTHGEDGKTFAEKTGSGPLAGSPFLNSDGNERKFDLSGFFVGMSFRFYIQ